MAKAERETGDETAPGRTTLQQTFFDLAKQWTRLANELDDAYALLKALNELDLEEASTSDGDLSSLEKAKASQQAPRIRLP